MRVEEHAERGRDVPVGHLLVREDEDGVERLRGKCAAAEGPFVEPVPSPREVLTLRGCRPEGLLSEVLAQPGGTPRSLGDLGVEVRDGVVPPFTPVWHDSEAARRALADVVHDLENGLSCFEEVVAHLGRCGVTVVLERTARARAAERPTEEEGRRPQQLRPGPAGARPRGRHGIAARRGAAGPRPRPAPALPA
ncbi:hypothetical protein [Streptomyces sp. NPDC093808]|uniref:hypothetical protein n=1 Tax=unclassified Streptomyces TaxID=2593676 RepID=UPI00344C718B